jgi:hypothetical protein
MQSSITVRINKIEEHHEYKLFDRNKSVVRAIIPEGFIFAEEGKQIIGAAYGMITRANSIHRGVLRNPLNQHSHQRLERFTPPQVAYCIYGGTSFL